MREWKTYGTHGGMRTFATLATEAGRLLVSEHLSACDCLAAETLNQNKYQDRWLWSLFDLAWSPAAGSPLQATRSAWWKNVRIPLDQVDEQRRVWGAKLETPIGLALAFIPDPPDSFCSVLEDLFSASVYAIDRLERDVEDALARTQVDTSTLPVDPHAGATGTTATAAPDDAPPALKVNDTRVIETMARIDASRLLSAEMIADEMHATQRLSDRTIRKIVRRLIGMGLAERPEGTRSGARLTMKGRRLVPKIAD